MFSWQQWSRHGLLILCVTWGHCHKIMHARLVANKQKMASLQGPTTMSTVTSLYNTVLQQDQQNTSQVTMATVCTSDSTQVDNLLSVSRCI